MQAKENNQQVNTMKANSTINHQVHRPAKGNALQPSKIVSTQVINQQNIQNFVQQHHPIKSTGLQVSNQINKPKTISNTENALKPALQTKPNVQQANNKCPQGKNEIVDGKIKKVIAPKANSASKMKAKKTTKLNGQKAAYNNKKVSTKTTSQPQQQSVKPVECDFIIFCDENDEPVIQAVAKENIDESTSKNENKIEKKKGLAERNVKPVQQQNVQVNLKATVSRQQIENSVVQQSSVTSVQSTTVKTTVLKSITNVQTAANVQTTKPNIEPIKNVIKDAIKETVVPIDNLTLNETVNDENTFDEITLNEQSTIENKENDPTLMSIDLGKDEEMEVQQDQYRDVSGDMCCQEFSTEIYLYMLRRELKFLPDPAYMNKQPEINSKMRAMLVDWLIDVGIEYELENETVFLTISYIDQFLSSLTISLQNFQLLGTAALFIASKYEEIYPPELKDFIFVTDDAYTKLQMLSMEKVILKSLNFSVSPPTIFYFLKYFLTKLSLPIYVQYFAEYLCFLSLLHTDPFLSYSPSDIAISSIILALHTYTLTDVINLDDFKELTKIHFCLDDEGKLSNAKAILIRQSCVNAMYKLQKTASEDAQQAVYTKYSSEKYLSVANVEIADEVPLVETFFN